MAQTAPTPHGGSTPHRHRDKQATSWVIGVILILLGVAFLLERSGYFVLAGNWWAIFIYLASGASLYNAWRSYRAQGGLDSGAGGSLVWGLVLAVIATIFAFNLAWDLWWPAILIAVGVGILVAYALRTPEQESGDDGPNPR